MVDYPDAVLVSRVPHCPPVYMGKGQSGPDATDITKAERYPYPVAVAKLAYARARVIRQGHPEVAATLDIEIPTCRTNPQ